jgi:hypothetical protein
MTTEPDDALLWALEHYEHDLPGTVGAATKAYRAGHAARDAEVEALRAENERLRRCLMPVMMMMAQAECIDEPLPDDAVVLSFMGSGASDQVTAGEIRAALGSRT